MAERAQRTENDLSNGKSLLDALERVMRQVEYHCFADIHYKRIDPFFKELCLVIAEVLVLKPGSIIKINGMDICISLAQDVYSQLNNDHLQLVYDNFHNVTTRVYNKKAYLRTALYNAVFELESSEVNNSYI